MEQSWLLILTLVLFLTTYYYFQHNRQCRSQKMVVQELLDQAMTVNDRLQQQQHLQQLIQQREQVRKDREQVVAQRNNLHQRYKQLKLRPGHQQRENTYPTHEQQQVNTISPSTEQTHTYSNYPLRVEGFATAGGWKSISSEANDAWCEKNCDSTPQATQCSTLCEKTGNCKARDKRATDTYCNNLSSSTTRPTWFSEYCDCSGSPTPTSPTPTSSTPTSLTPTSPTPTSPTPTSSTPTTPTPTSPTPTSPSGTGSCPAWAGSSTVDTYVYKMDEWGCAYNATTKDYGRSKSCKQNNLDPSTGQLQTGSKNAACAWVSACDGNDKCLKRCPAAVAIGGGETTFDPLAGGWDGLGRGLWQVNDYNLDKFGLNSDGDAQNPVKMAKAVQGKTNQGMYLSPPGFCWATCTGKACNPDAQSGWDFGDNRADRYISEAKKSCSAAIKSLKGTDVSDDYWISPNECAVGPPPSAGGDTPLTGGTNRCGTSWATAKGGEACPSGADGDCPPGQQCYSDVPTN